jgi:hypothetical protein
MAQVHFELEGLELLRSAGAGFGAHFLAGPLLEAAEFLVDVHGGGWVWWVGCWGEGSEGQRCRMVKAERKRSEGWRSGPVPLVQAMA